MDYDVKKGAAKGGKALAGTGIALAMATVVVKLFEENALAIPDSIRAEVVGGLAMAFAFGFEMLRNWLKVRGLLTH